MRILLPVNFSLLYASMFLSLGLSKIIMILKAGIISEEYSQMQILLEVESSHPTTTLKKVKEKNNFSFLLLECLCIFALTVSLMWNRKLNKIPAS